MEATVNEILKAVQLINQKQNFLLTKSFNYKSLKERILERDQETLEELQAESIMLDIIEDEIDKELKEVIKEFDLIEVEGA